MAMAWQLLCRLLSSSATQGQQQSGVDCAVLFICLTAVQATILMALLQPAPEVSFAGLTPFCLPEAVIMTGCASARCLHACCVQHHALAQSISRTLLPEAFTGVALYVCGMTCICSDQNASLRLSCRCMTSLTMSLSSVTVHAPPLANGSRLALMSTCNCC